MQEIIATRITHRGKPAIRVVGVTHRGSGSFSDGVALIGGNRADRCDWVVIRQEWRSFRTEDGHWAGGYVPDTAVVHGVRASEAAAHAEARTLKGGRVVRVQDKEV